MNSKMSWKMISVAIVAMHLRLHLYHCYHKAQVITLCLIYMTRIQTNVFSGFHNKVTSNRSNKEITQQNIWKDLWNNLDHVCCHQLGFAESTSSTAVGMGSYGGSCGSQKIVINFTNRRPLCWLFFNPHIHSLAQDCWLASQL